MAVKSGYMHYRRNNVKLLPAEQTIAEAIAYKSIYCIIIQSIISGRSIDSLSVKTTPMFIKQSDGSIVLTDYLSIIKQSNEALAACVKLDSKASVISTYDMDIWTLNIVVTNLSRINRMAMDINKSNKKSDKIGQYTIADIIYNRLLFGDNIISNQSISTLPFGTNKMAIAPMYKDIDSNIRYTVNKYICSNDKNNTVLGLDISKKPMFKTLDSLSSNESIARGKSNPNFGVSVNPEHYIVLNKNGKTDSDYIQSLVDKLQSLKEVV